MKPAFAPRGARLSWLAVLVLCGALAGCGVTPDKPQRPTQYDFGPGPTAAASGASAAALAPLVLSDVETTGAFDGSGVLYRLGYADGHQLRSYALARWSAPPPQLIRQRLREQLAADRAVLDLGESAALARSGGAMPRVLRIQLEEFSHYFDSPTQSAGLVRLRATLMEVTPAGEKLVAQRSIVMRSPASTPDAPGGVRALAAATDAAAGEIGRWLAGLH
ncbi:MAG TPA: ABC-type transport auxiliary lipoprotein family protein [Ramlibacter sp.]|nr:ABC-type transport auxiliary lipoprotein family protein [Ramlibacter sp.]